MAESVSSPSGRVPAIAPWAEAVKRVFWAAMVLVAVVCLILGAGVGILWAFSDPQNAPHGGLLLGLPGGVLFLQGVLAAIAARWIRRCWRGYQVGAPLLALVMPVAYLISPTAVVLAGEIGLAPFALISWLAH
jgi:hypothetical protein